VQKQPKRDNGARKANRFSQLVLSLNYTSQEKFQKSAGIHKKKLEKKLQKLKNKFH
jgi:hypothetical protein